MGPLGYNLFHHHFPDHFHTIHALVPGEGSKRPGLFYQGSKTVDEYLAAAHWLPVKNKGQGKF